MSATIDAAEYQAVMAKQKTNKYKNRRATRIIDGIEVKFHSEMEARRSDDLELLRSQKKIHTIIRQPRFPMEVGGKVVTTYVADFQYFDVETRKWVIEDVKGVKTEAYRIKKKLMKSLYKVDIQEVTA